MSSTIYGASAVTNSNTTTTKKSNAELGKDDEWTPERIKERGLILLKFMESRWQLNMGDESKKLALLHLSFLDESSAVRAAEESALEEEPSV